MGRSDFDYIQIFIFLSQEAERTAPPKGNFRPGTAVSEERQEEPSFPAESAF